MPDLMRNILRGAGTVLELMPSRPARFQAGRRLRTSPEALAHDWRVVGDHLRNAISRTGRMKVADGTRK